MLLENEMRTSGGQILMLHFNILYIIQCEVKIAKWKHV